MSRELLFSVNKNDFDIQTFRCGGKGGQRRDKKDTGVRLIHRASGAKGESREERSQAQNKKIAFNRLIATNEFKMWHAMMCSELMQGKSIETEVKEAMEEKNLKVEVKREGKWAEE